MHKRIQWVVAFLLVAALAAGLGLAAPQASEARGGIWTVNVFSGTEPGASPLVWTGATNTINYSWGAGAPVIGGAVTGAPADNFSVVFESTIYFDAGTYRFTATVDDGVRVTLSGVPVISGWQALGLRTLQSDYTVPVSGNQIVRVEMFDAAGDATIQFGWTVPSSGGTGTTGGACVEGFGLYTTCPFGSSPGSSPAPVGWPATSGPRAICANGYNSCSTDAATICAAQGGVLYWCTGGTGGGPSWTAEYFNNLDLGGAPVLTSTLPASGINQNWGTSSPGGAVPVDGWSARFTRTLNVPGDMPESMYLFYARADDNFRFTIDTTVIIDKWDTFAAGQLFTAEVALLPGPHTFKFEFRDREAAALAFLTWTPPNAQNPVLRPDGQGVPISPVGDGQGGLAALTATVKIPVLNVRSGPTTAASIIAKINEGGVYTAIARSGDNQWVKIWLDASTSGWVSAQYVTLSGDIASLPVGEGTAAPAAPQPIGVRARVLGNLRIRQGPSTRTPRIGLMPWGTEVDVVGRSYGNVWYQVIHDGVVGWSYAPYMRIIEGSIDQVPYTDGTEPTYPPPPPTSGIVVQAFGNMRIRSGPGLSFPQINKIPWGTQVQLLARDATGYWYKIQYGPVIGWSFSAWYRPVQGDVMSVPVAAQ